MTKQLSGLLLAAMLVLSLSVSGASAQGVSNLPVEGLWIGRFFGQDEDTSKAAASAFCGVHTSSFQELYFQFGRVKAVLNHGASDLIEIQPSARGKPVLVPFTRDDVPVVDLNAQRIVVATFEIWADESKPEIED